MRSFYLVKAADRSLFPVIFDDGDVDERLEAEHIRAPTQEELSSSNN